MFDYREGEVFWCTADLGWVTGHTYTYGPLLAGATSVMFEVSAYYSCLCVSVRRFGCLRCSPMPGPLLNGAAQPKIATPCASLTSMALDPYPLLCPYLLY